MSNVTILQFSEQREICTGKKPRRLGSPEQSRVPELSEGIPDECAPAPSLLPVAEFDSRLNPPPVKRAYEKTRKKHLTGDEVELLVRVAKQSEHGKRNALMILMAYRHALRASEVVSLKWDQIDIKTGELFLPRKKNGRDSTHLLNAMEVRELKALQRRLKSPYVFESERQGPLTPRGFFKIVYEAASRLGMQNVNPHSLRHAAGYELINSDVSLRVIQEYMGHRSISTTTKYTELNSKQFQRVNRLL